MKMKFNYALLALAIISLVGGAVAAQKKNEASMTCRDSIFGDRLKSHCEIKEQTLLPGGVINVDGLRNGGVAVEGLDRNEVFAGRRIQTAAPTISEADLLAARIRIGTSGFWLPAEGPTT